MVYNLELGQQVSFILSLIFPTMMVKTLPYLIEKEIEESFCINDISNTDFRKTLPTSLKYNRILLVKSGYGSITIDDKKIKISGSEIILLSKGQVFQYDKETIINGFQLSFGDCFWEKSPASASNCKAVLFNNTSANQQLPLSSSELQHFEKLFITLLEEHQQTHYINKIDALAAYLKIIMIKIANIRTTNEDVRDNQEYLIYRRFMDLLSIKYKNQHEVSHYAEQMAISPRRLSEICKKCNGQSAKTIIKGQLLSEAKRALQFSSVTVKHIAYDLSFGTPEQFSHFFKKNTKCAPAEYRSKFLNLAN
jgi:AraC family transcriptional activator of pobA